MYFLPFSFSNNNYQYKLPYCNTFDNQPNQNNNTSQNTTYSSRYICSRNTIYRKLGIVNEVETQKFLSTFLQSTKFLNPVNTNVKTHYSLLTPMSKNCKTAWLNEKYLAFTNGPYIYACNTNEKLPTKYAPVCCSRHCDTSNISSMSQAYYGLKLVTGHENGDIILNNTEANNKRLIYRNAYQNSVTSITSQDNFIYFTQKNEKTISIIDLRCKEHLVIPVEQRVTNIYPNELMLALTTSSTHNNSFVYDLRNYSSYHSAKWGSNKSLAWLSYRYLVSNTCVMDIQSEAKYIIESIHNQPTSLLVISNDKREIFSGHTGFFQISAEQSEKYNYQPKSLLCAGGRLAQTAKINNFNNKDIAVYDGTNIWTFKNCFKDSKQPIEDIFHDYDEKHFNANIIR